MAINAFDATDLEIESLTALFRLLSDKTRLQILILLANGEQNVTWLCKQSKLPQPTVSHHLGLLRASNVVANRRDGKQVFYQVNGRVDLDQAESISIHASDFVVTITRTEGQVSVTTKSQPGHSDRVR